MARTERPYEVFCGIDVGKSFHHACPLDLDGRRLHDKALTNDEGELRAVFTKLQAHGRVLVVIDQPASIGALAIAIARAMNIDIAYLPGLTMRRLADLHPGQSKTDARVPTSSPTPHCPTPGPCAGSAPTMRPSPTCPCWPATTTT